MSVEIRYDEVGPFFWWQEGRSTLLLRPEFKVRKKIGLKSDLLAKATGSKKNVNLRILDMTAGLCRDAFHLACLGNAVIALEANNSVYQVTSFYLQKNLPKGQLNLLNKKADAFTLEQLTLSASESDEILPFDVIYYDPMFPIKNKSAKSGKESQLLKLLGYKGSLDEEIALLTSIVAMEDKRLSHKKRPRLVVKRPLDAKEILPNPTVVLKGRAVRYDIYLPSYTLRTEINHR